MKTIQVFKQSGVAAIEFALVLPFLLLLVLGTAELGRAFYQYNTLTKAVRDGARHLSTHAILGSTEVILITDPLRDETKKLVVYGDIDGSDNPIIPKFTTGDVDVDDKVPLHVRVTARYEYVPMLFPTSLPTFGISDPIPLSPILNASVTMRAL